MASPKELGGGHKSGMTKADVSAIIKEQLADKEKEKREAEAVGASVSSIVQDLKGLVESSVAAAVAKSAGPPQKRVQRAGGATVASVETDSTAVEALEAEAEQAASKLMLRFSNIGSKAGKRG